MMFLWIKALHIAAIVTWVSGLLMLALLTSALVNAPVPSLPQERRLMAALGRWDRTVTSPAMVLAWVLGISLAVHGDWFTASWMTTKLVLVMSLSALHGVLAGRLRRMRGGLSQQPSINLRHAGGLTLLGTAAIATLVVVKPF